MRLLRDGNGQLSGAVRVCDHGGEVGARQIAHVNVAAHPTADSTLQQFREVITGEKPYRFLVHDRDSIYSSAFDSAVEAEA